MLFVISLLCDVMCGSGGEVLLHMPLQGGGGVLCRGNFGRLFFILCQSPDLGGFDLCRGNGEHYRTSMGATVEGIYFSD